MVRLISNKFLLKLLLLNFTVCTLILMNYNKIFKISNRKFINFVENMLITQYRMDIIMIFTKSMLIQFLIEEDNTKCKLFVSLFI